MTTQTSVCLKYLLQKDIDNFEKKAISKSKFLYTNFIYEIKNIKILTTFATARL